MNFVRHKRGNLRPALVLNADYKPLSHFPLSLWSWQDAVRAVFQDRVVVVQSYDEIVHSPTFSMPLPAVIALKAYQKQGGKNGTAAFTRYNVYLRDHFSCQYCGAKHDLTFDHVVPASRGGPLSFENIVARCTLCNMKKADKTLKEAGMTLRSQPRSPSIHDLLEAGRHFPSPMVLDEWRDFCYWTVPLDATIQDLQDNGTTEAGRF